MELVNFSEESILSMEQRRRAAFINSLSGFKSASLIGTIDANGATNLAIFSSIVHIGAHPPLIGFINRPDSVCRHTLENILETKQYTINHIHEDIYMEAHQTAARYPKEVSEFEATGLSPEFLPNFKAPFVKESTIKYGLEFIEKHDLKINNTILVIGKVIEVLFPDHSMNEDGSLDLERAGTITLSGLDSYHTTSKIARLSYAKPDILPKIIG